MEPQPAPPRADDPARGNILVIDDSEVARDLVCGQVAACGYRPIAARSGEEGLELLARGGFDLVVSDMEMPGMSGLDVLRSIKSDAPDLPVILLSSQTQMDVVLAAMREGAFDYVRKDEDLEALGRALGRALGHLALLQENRDLVAELQAMNQQLESKVHERTRQLENANEQLVHESAQTERAMSALQEAQAQLVHAEKMASIGTLTAGIAHEINNPLAYVANNLAVLERDCRSLSEVLEAYEQAHPALAAASPELAGRIDQIGEAVDLPYIRANLERLLSSTRQGVNG